MLEFTLTTCFGSSSCHPALPYYQNFEAYQRWKVCLCSSSWPFPCIVNFMNCCRCWARSCCCCLIIWECRWNLDGVDCWTLLNCWFCWRLDRIDCLIEGLVAYEVCITDCWEVFNRFGCRRFWCCYLALFALSSTAVVLGYGCRDTMENYVVVRNKGLRGSVSIGLSLDE